MVIFKGCCKVLDTGNLLSTLQSAWCPHIDSKTQSISLPLSQILSKNLLSAESAVLDAVGIVNPSFRWISWWIQTLICFWTNTASRLVLALCKLRQGAQIIEEMCTALETGRIKWCGNLCLLDKQHHIIPNAQKVCGEEGKQRSSFYTSRVNHLGEQLHCSTILVHSYLYFILLLLCTCAALQLGSFLLIHHEFYNFRLFLCIHKIG